MATAKATPIEEGDNEDNYVIELNRVREKIKTKFVELAECLKARETQLLIDLDNILASYLSFRTDLEKINEKKRDLETTKALLQKQLLTSLNKSFHENFLSQLNTEIKSIKTPLKPKMITFECDSNKMLAELNTLGKLLGKVRSGIDYTNKKLPLVRVCETGNGIKQLNNPFGITVDKKTGNIYIADQYNNCVKVFNSTGSYLFKFSETRLDGNLSYPRDVAIYGDRILITESCNCILNYQLNGMFISRIGREGRGELEFDYPRGLTISEWNGDIYICDNNNNRVQILKEDFSFKAQFGKCQLIHPRDVELSKEYIYVLDAADPCLHLFNYSYILQKSVITQGDGMDVVNPCYFFIDRTDNVLITDRECNSVLIFNSEFLLSHKIPVSNCPAGVAVDNQGRVIVVCQADKDCLQIF